jgi:hypothetical protein
MKKIANIRADNLVWRTLNYMQLKVFVSIKGACATIRRIGTKFETLEE